MTATYGSAEWSAGAAARHGRRAAGLAGGRAGGLRRGRRHRPSATSGATCDIETKPDRTFVTQADTAIERRIRERLADAFPDHGLVGEEYGIEAGDASRALVHRPDRRHPQLHPWHPAVRHAPGGRARRRAAGRGHLGAGDRRALVGVPRRRGVGAQPGRADAAAIRSPGSTALADAQVLYGSRRDIADSGQAPGFDGLARRRLARARVRRLLGLHPARRGRRRGDGRGRPEAWDAAAPFVDHRGGRRPGHRLRRRRGPSTAGTFLATNGRLHDSDPRAAAAAGSTLARAGTAGPLRCGPAGPSGRAMRHLGPRHTEAGHALRRMKEPTMTSDHLDRPSARPRDRVPRRRGDRRVERLARGTSEPEGAVRCARRRRAVLDRPRVEVTGPAFARTRFERAYVAMTHRPDRLSTSNRRATHRRRRPPTLVG